MKRIVEFKYNDNKYIFIEDEEVIFEILREDMKFDIKKFYEAFFEGKKEYNDIEIKNTIQDDKVGGHIYQVVSQLIKEVVSKLEQTEVNKVSEV